MGVKRWKCEVRMGNKQVDGWLYNNKRKSAARTLATATQRTTKLTLFSLRSSQCGKEFSRRFDLRKHKARCEVLIVAGGGKLGGAGRVGLGYPKVPAVISVDTSFFENNSYICGVISDVDTEYAIERGLGGEQKTGGMTPTVISGSESDGEGVPGGGGSLSEQGKSTSIREEDIKAGEALLGLMTRS